MIIALVIIGLLVCAIGVVVYEQDKKIKFLEAQLEDFVSSDEIKQGLQPIADKIDDLAPKQ